MRIEDAELCPYRLPMKNLNRKEYKKIIKEFRKTCPLAQIEHQWVSFQEGGCNPVLMKVYGTIIKRANPKNMHEWYHAFEYEGFHFVIQYYGSPSLKSKYGELKVKPFHLLFATVTKDDNCKIINPPDVANEYDKIFEKQHYIYRFPFEII